MTCRSRESDSARTAQFICRDELLRPAPAVRFGAQTDYLCRRRQASSLTSGRRIITSGGCPLGKDHSDCLGPCCRRVLPLATTFAGYPCLSSSYCLRFPSPTPKPMASRLEHGRDKVRRAFPTDFLLICAPGGDCDSDKSVVIGSRVVAERSPVGNWRPTTLRRVPITTAAGPDALREKAPGAAKAMALMHVL